MIRMNGGKAFLELLRGAGVHYLFGNPGHTELPILDALADMPDIQYVLGLNEAVSIAMADGYAMASGELGVFCSHITAGFGNAVGMLYDATKTAVPLLVIAGQQDSRFSLSEPALWSDLVSLAKPLTKWAYQVEQINDLGQAMRRAIKVALTPPMGPVFLSLPSHILRGEADFEFVPPAYISTKVRGDRDGIVRVCALLREAHNPLIIAGDEVSKSQALPELQALAELLGCPVYSEPSSNTLNFPSDHLLYQGTLPRLQQGVRDILAEADLLLALGAELFTMAAYADVDPMPPDLRLIQINADAWQLGKNYAPEVALWGDIKATLTEMVEEIRGQQTSDRAEYSREKIGHFARRKAEMLAAADRHASSEEARRPMAGAVLMKALVDLIPQNGVIVDESQTTGLSLRTFLFRRNLTYFWLKGGGLGWGLPSSVGVSFALPNRPVLALLADGGSMYTIQGLWTAARYRAKVVFVICNNRQYRIVKHRLHNYAGAAAKQRKYIGVELQDPVIDFVGLGRSLGVWSTRVEHPDQLGDALRDALQQDGPALLDILVEGSYPENQ